jgi:methylmalonyl-CoA mutase
MQIDDFAPNLSFFFSNGMDPEYAVIGRVARRIWARAMRERYGAGARSQMLKYHIQTSGRSLHAREIQFNDIRTTLQALYALFDNCNSLHTNAYDEAITTPTEESSSRGRHPADHQSRARSQQEPEPVAGLVHHRAADRHRRGSGLSRVRESSERGGVLGSMETMYQRGKIQEESLYYEHKKHDGSLPIVGVNMFLPEAGSSEQIRDAELIRSTDDEKDQQVAAVRDWQARNAARRPAALARLQEVAASGGNVFSELMEAVKVASLGQISHALYQVGGQYRRNM